MKTHVEIIESLTEQDLTIENLTGARRLILSVSEENLIIQIESGNTYTIYPHYWEKILLRMLQLSPEQRKAPSMYTITHWNANQGNPNNHVSPYLAAVILHFNPEIQAG
ncbi:MAG: hypothetical protein KDC59_20975 [Saprospiraceae bacterium]|nr:hypothetical protein [Saprospiraceae bacterium]